MIADIKKLGHSFGSKKTFWDVSFCLEKGQMFGILGDSGCGKTTLLRCLAGLERSCEGEIYLRGKLVQSQALFTPAYACQVGFVFQEFALFPHMTVAENILFGVSKRKEKKETLKKLAQLFRIESFLNKYPHEISGGQRQRVALARALAPKPDLLLLDEAFSNLDDNLRQELLDELREIFNQVGASVLFVTHSESEIFQWADCAGIMSGGQLHQVGSVSALYNKPKNPLVAKSFGRGSFLCAEQRGGRWQTGFGSLPCSDTGLNLQKNQIFIRPEEVKVTFSSSSQQLSVIHRQDFGAYQLLSIQNRESKEVLLAQVPSGLSVKEKAFVLVELAPPLERLFSEEEL